ncbi:hypothetical protein Aab01nite_85950 [Paractinoplanes abujensis]|uniref:Uncharacterized protein n=1 Tax=Paractinoplanes abujensis TaxID=882441 RepID=A0A7W7CVF7_9ACTN|nr:hypothetical protein [Actinoplanes abujensis]MBB4695397.1 hypothetical protein [Actinoplanes abujensis]GID25005.1 hypothetical protein Aab01nite_85950 [Actinoplanes abujensis]
MGGRGGKGRSSKPPGPGAPPPVPPPEVAEPDTETEQVAAPADRIRSTVFELLGSAEGWVALSDIRDALSDLSRQEVDAALRELFRDPNVTLVPETNQKVLTQEQRDAAIRIGNQDNHAINIRKPIDSGARERIVSGGVTAASDADLAMAQRDTATPGALYDEIRAEVRRRRDTP